MNRRRFIQSIGAAGLATAVPTAAVSAVAARGWDGPPWKRTIYRRMDMIGSPYAVHYLFRTETGWDWEWCALTGDRPSDTRLQELDQQAYVAFRRIGVL